MNSNKWGALSMRDRAFLIRKAVRNGITDINSIRDTWEHRFDGESSQPTEDEYIAQRARTRISEALEHARNRKETVTPYIRKSEQYKKAEEEALNQTLEELNKLSQELAILQADPRKGIQGKYNPVSKRIEYQPARTVSQVEKEIKDKESLLQTQLYHCNQDHVHGFGCLATVMDDYGKTETWNKRFAKNPEKQGFKKINPEDIKEGDIVQFKNDGLPFHAMMANTNYQPEYSNMRFNGSNGEDIVRINSKYPSNYADIDAYRFVGDKADSLQWKKEYREKYGHQFSGEEDQDSSTIPTPFFSSVLDSASSKYLQDITSPKVPYKHSTEEPNLYQRDILHQDIAGISDVTQKVKFGDGDLYLYNGKTEDKDPFSVFIKAKNLPYFYQAQKRYLDTIPMEHFDVISQKDLRKYMPKRDYIGSNAKSTAAQNEEVREKVAKLIPGFTDSLSVIANRHNINPSLMYRRISKEGYLDQQAKLYNEVIPSTAQKDFFDDAADQEVSGFNEFGLDDIRDVLESNQLKLTKPVQWRPDENVRYNEKDRRVYSVYFPTLWDAMEVKAAELARRKEIMKQRGHSGRDLDIWTNASYNLGTEHEDLNDTEWIRKTYSFPDYSHLFKK